MNRKLNILLFQPPFWTLNSPSIGLSNLKASLRDGGFGVSIRYLNLDLAAVLGRETYGWIQEHPVEVLAGELAFASYLRGPESSEEILEGLTRLGAQNHVPGASRTRYQDVLVAIQAFMDAFKAEAPWRGFDLVGITTTFGLVPGLSLAKAIKSSTSPPPIVLGGGHCDGSLGEDLMKAFPWVDFVVRGEAEVSLVQLATSLAQGAGPSGAIDGLIWREDAKVRSADRSVARISNLDGLPSPSYSDWLGRIKELGWADQPGCRLPLETSRGCWYGERTTCVFCGLNGTGREFRVKSTDRILEEYQSLVATGVEDLYAVDNVMAREHFQGLIPAIAALEKKSRLFFEVRPTVGREDLERLKKARVEVLQPGIESLNADLLALMQKGVTAAQNVRLLRWCAELGLSVVWNLLWGLPGERADHYREMAALVPSLFHMNPPSTLSNRIHVDRFSPLYERHKEEIRPFEAYEMMFGLSEGETMDLAFHHRFMAADPDVVAAVQDLDRTLREWKDLAGRTVFISRRIGGVRVFYDTRPCALQEEVVLSELETSLYDLLAKGYSRDRMQRTCGLPDETIGPMLAAFEKKRWIGRLGDIYLGLATEMDEDLLQGIPESVQRDVAIALFSGAQRAKGR